MFYTDGHVIKRPTAGQDSAGGATRTLADHLTVSGKLWGLSGDKRLSSDKVSYYADAKFATDIADIKKTDVYISPDGEEYVIKDVIKRTRPNGSGHLEIALEMVR